MIDTTKPSLSADLCVDLPTLLETRLLVQANSGGGKSWALRRLLEQTATRVQQLVIDPEGEFATLREKFDYVIAAPHGADAVATPQTAALLARRLLETGVSAVLDIYDLKAHERLLFVRRFLEALVNAPRALWHPVMIVVDEAHVFCPQAGSAESMQAVIDVCTRGRKRGLCAVLATQRLSKLHKDAAAEMLNKLIGRTGLDVDVKRAADELGMTPREAMEQLRPLPAGEFYAFGPALSPVVTRTMIGNVVTTHPKAGQRLMQAPPAPSKGVLASLAKLADLQRDAEEEARTVEALQAQVSDLRGKLTRAERRAETSGVHEAEVDRRIRDAVAAVRKEVPRAPDDGAASKALRKILDIATAAIAKPADAPSAPAVAPRVTIVPAPVPKPSASRSGAPSQRLLDAIAWWAAAGIESPTRHQVAFVAGYTVNGHFNNQCGDLRARGLIDYPGGGTLCATDAGRAIAQGPGAKPTRAVLVERVLAVLKGEPQRRLFSALVDAGVPLTRDELASRCGYTVNGHFNNLCGALAGIGIAEYPGKGRVALAAIFRGLA